MHTTKRLVPLIIRFFLCIRSTNPTKVKQPFSESHQKSLLQLHLIIFLCVFRFASPEAYEVTKKGAKHFHNKFFSHSLTLFLFMISDCWKILGRMISF